MAFSLKPSFPPRSPVFLRGVFFQLICWSRHLPRFTQDKHRACFGPHKKKIYGAAVCSFAGDPCFFAPTSCSQKIFQVPPCFPPCGPPPISRLGLTFPWHLDAGRGPPKGSSQSPPPPTTPVSRPNHSPFFGALWPPTPFSVVQPPDNQMGGNPRQHACRSTRPF